MSEDTFETLLARNIRLVRMLVNTRLKRCIYAEDLVQEILLRAFLHRDQLDADAKFTNWIWSIALNEIRSFLRRRHGMASLEDFPNLDLPDDAVSPLARLEGIEARDQLRVCLAQLSERDQATIRLKDIEDRSIREMAAAIHSTESAAKTAHFRATKRLARIMRARTCAARIVARATA